MKKYLFVISLFLVIFPVASNAAVLRAGDDVIITNDQVVEDDFYAAGEQISSSGEVRGDFYAAGATFTNNGKIDGDVVVVAGTVDIHAEVTDDVRVAAGEITIAGPVVGDLVVFGGTLEVLSTAQIGGDILFYGGEAKILGSVEGSVLGAAEKVRIDATVGKDIDMALSELTLGDRAEVLGDISYTSPNDLVRSQNAVVVGEIVKNTAPATVPVSYDSIIISFVIILFSALILQMLLRPQLIKMQPIWTDKVGVAGLIGLGTVILTPLLIGLMLASLLGSLVGVIALLAFIMLIFLSVSLMSVMLGILLAKHVGHMKEPHVIYTIVGAAILQLMFFVPVVGPILLLMGFFITMGGIVLFAYRSLKA